MVRQDEVDFYALLRSRATRHIRTPEGRFTSVGGESVRSLIAECGINHKRAWYLLWKWSGRGWYDYGVCVDLGWLTPECPDALQPGYPKPCGGIDG